MLAWLWWDGAYLACDEKNFTDGRTSPLLRQKMGAGLWDSSSSNKYHKYCES